MEVRDFVLDSTRTRKSSKFFYQGTIENGTRPWEKENHQLSDSVRWSPGYVIVPRRLIFFFWGGGGCVGCVTQNSGFPAPPTKKTRRWFSRETDFYFSVSRFLTGSGTELRRFSTEPYGVTHDFLWFFQREDSVEWYGVSDQKYYYSWASATIEFLQLVSWMLSSTVSIFPSAFEILMPRHTGSTELRQLRKL